ncbi:hypothetical protein LINPERPRIM_LOCUS20797, partial [Linum perenne]
MAATRAPFPTPRRYRLHCVIIWGLGIWRAKLVNHLVNLLELGLR